MKQTTFSAGGFEKYGKTTRRALFLSEMDCAVPWSKLCKLIEPYYPKTGSGRPPVLLERLLRVYFLQHWFKLSDMAVNDALYESISMRSFVGVDLGLGPIPDETMMCKFRHLLMRHELDHCLIEAVGRSLQERGMKVAGGIIVDARIIAASHTSLALPRCAFAT